MLPSASPVSPASPDCIADAAFGIACFARLAFGFFARSRACGAGYETSSSFRTVMRIFVFDL